MNEEMVSVVDLMEAFRSGRVVAPVGTKTLFLLLVNPDGKINMEGIVATEHIDEIAYALMNAKRSRLTIGSEAPNVETDHEIGEAE